MLKPHTPKCYPVIVKTANNMAGHSTNPLFKKLGLKEGYSILLIHAPANYMALIGNVADGLVLKQGQ